MGGIATFVGRLFGARTPSVSNVTTTARDLLPSTSSEDPNSAVLGTEADSNPVTGKNALKISLAKSANTPKDTTYSSIDKSGVNR